MERRVFAWIVQHLRPLLCIPGLPHLFDAALFAWTALIHPERRAAMEALEEEVLGHWPCTLGTHRFGGSAYRVGGRDIAHLHGNGLLDVHVGRNRAAAIVADGRAERHHALGDSAWVSFWLENREDVPAAMVIIGKAKELET